jgi:winged helix DNA-binding protein
MTGFDIPHLRLTSQHLAGNKFVGAAEVVTWLGAVQSQDYAGAKWAIAQRARGLSDAAFEAAFAAGEILRTHVMRPTWHFVAPADIRWLLALTAPRVRAASAYGYRTLGLDQDIFKRSNSVLTRALRDSRPLTRAELASALGRAGIEARDVRLAHLIMRAELDGVICSGARRGKQFTYALLDERVPATKTLRRDEALAELSKRHFTSRGPATLQDFTWWSGLTMSDAQTGLEMVKRGLLHHETDGKTYWFAASMPSATERSQTACLLPNYDEYVVGYSDRKAIFDSSHAAKLDARNNPLFQHTMVIDGRIAGTWKRTLRKDAVLIELAPFAPLARAERQAVHKAAEKYATFLELPMVMED